MKITQEKGFVKGNYYAFVSATEGWTDGMRRSWAAHPVQKCTGVASCDASLAAFEHVRGGGWLYEDSEFEEVSPSYYEQQKGTDSHMPLYTTPMLSRWVRILEECINRHGLNNEEVKMNLEDIKTNNLKEAKKQFDNERKNEEIEFAKLQLKIATDEVNRLDREIKKLTEEKKPHLEVINRFTK